MLRMGEYDPLMQAVLGARIEVQRTVPGDLFGRNSRRGSVFKEPRSGFGSSQVGVPGKNVVEHRLSMSADMPSGGSLPRHE